MCVLYEGSGTLSPVNSPSSSSSSSSSLSQCDEYALIIDDADSSNVSVCGGRLRHVPVYRSRGQQVRVYIRPQHSFLLHYNGTTPLVYTINQSVYSVRHTLAAAENIIPGVRPVSHGHIYSVKLSGTKKFMFKIYSGLKRFVHHLTRRK